MEIHVPETRQRRSYSIASAPDDQLNLTFLVEVLPAGIFGLALDTLRAGDELLIQGPFGHLRLHHSERPRIMVAFDAGIAPILAMLRDEERSASNTPITVYYASQYDPLPYAAELARLCDQRPHLKVVSTPAIPSDWTGDVARRLGSLTRFAAGEIGDASQHDAYLCGSPAMCDAFTTLLAAKGMPERQIWSERFYPAVPIPSNRREPESRKVEP